MEKRGVGVYVEIKSASGVGVAEIISVVKSMKTPAVVSAFDHSKLEQIKKQAPDMRLMALFKQPTRQMVRICREIGAQEAGIAYRQANSDMAKRFVDASIPLFCYTVNKPKLFEEARKMGLSGVFTDYPGLALASMGAKTA
jgi:glycerophosphoryl diester phosphodiesterase